VNMIYVAWAKLLSFQRLLCFFNFRWLQWAKIHKLK